MKKLLLLCFMFLTAVKSWYWGWPFEKKPPPDPKTPEGFETIRKGIGKEVYEKNITHEEYVQSLHGLKGKPDPKKMNFNITKDWYIQTFTDHILTDGGNKPEVDRDAIIAEIEREEM